MLPIGRPHHLRRLVLASLLDDSVDGDGFFLSKKGNGGENGEENCANRHLL
jgi:hypothetical protein